MKFKLNTLVAAVVLSASAMSANAALDSVSALAGNSEVIFSAWDANAGVGYTYDLNWNLFLNDLIGVDQFATVAGNAALAANANIKESLVGTNGIIFDDVLTGFNTANFSNFSEVEWNLAAYDLFGRARVLTTLGDSGVEFGSTNAQIRNTAFSIGTYAPASNGLITEFAEDTFAVSVAADLNGYAGNAGSTYANNVADTTNILGQSASLFVLAQDSTVAANGSKQSFKQQLLAFDDRKIVAKTYLQDGQWRLQIAAVAAVPEPETYAMLLAGLGFIGAIARRRNKQA